MQPIHHKHAVRLVIFCLCSLLMLLANAASTFAEELIPGLSSSSEGPQNALPDIPAPELPVLEPPSAHNAESHQPSKEGVSSLTSSLKPAALNTETPLKTPKKRHKPSSTEDQTEKTLDPEKKETVYRVPRIQTLDQAVDKALIEKLSPEARKNIEFLSRTLQLEHRSIRNDVIDTEETTAKDIGLLWQSAVEHSGTIRYAIQKLSKRDATGKPVEADSFTTRMVQSISRLGGVAGAVWTKNPASLFGSSLINEAVSSDPSQAFLSRVTDADMLLLTKEVETLQSQLITHYYEYRFAKERWDLSREGSLRLAKYYDHFLAHANETERQVLQPIVEPLFEASTEDEQQAKQAFVSARNTLALMVGADAISAIETELAAPTASQK
jgi:hypothetical protein